MYVCVCVRITDPESGPLGVPVICLACCLLFCLFVSCVSPAAARTPGWQARAVSSGERPSQ